MINVHTNSMDVISFVGALPLGEVESQCKGSATFWFDSLMETKEFIHIVVVNATFVVHQLAICMNVLNYQKNCISELSYTTCKVV
jgi:hypothetical protein